jgi:hypothetical protein
MELDQTFEVMPRRAGDSIMRRASVLTGRQDPGSKRSDLLPLSLMSLLKGRR